MQHAGNNALSDLADASTAGSTIIGAAGTNRAYRAIKKGGTVVGVIAIAIDAAGVAQKENTYDWIGGGVSITNDTVGVFLAPYGAAITIVERLPQKGESLTIAQWAAVFFQKWMGDEAKCEKSIDNFNAAGKEVVRYTNALAPYMATIAELAPPRAKGSQSYVVKKGDTVSEILNKNGLSWKNPLHRKWMQDANPEVEDFNVIQIGQRLSIPQTK